MMVTVSPSRVTLHPKRRRISMAAFTSVRSGQLWITLTPGARRAAARMGSTLFLAP